MSRKALIMQIVNTATYKHCLLSEGPRQMQCWFI